MPRYSLNLGFFHTQVPLLERFALARKDGFHAVEFFWPAGVSPTDIATELRTHDLTAELFNMFEGDYEHGERGIAGDPHRITEWRTALLEALDLADAIRCPRINVLTGSSTDQDRDAHLACLAENLRWAAPLAGNRGVALLLEPLNPVTHPSYLCRSTREAIRIIDEVAHGAVRVQYDVYQAQRGEGDIVETIRRHLPLIDHVQIADAPGRGKPGTGELNFDYILSQLDQMGYAGHVGLEYRATEDALSWLPFELRG